MKLRIETERVYMPRTKAQQSRGEAKSFIVRTHIMDGDARVASEVSPDHALLFAAAPDLLEALQVLLRCMDEAALGAFSNGNADPTGTIDEGEVLTSRWMDRARAAITNAEKQP